MTLNHQERRYLKALEKRLAWIDKKVAGLREDGATTGALIYLEEEGAALRWVFRMVSEIEDGPDQHAATP